MTVQTKLPIDQSVHVLESDARKWISKLKECADFIQADPEEIKLLRFHIKKLEGTVKALVEENNRLVLAEV